MADGKFIGAGVEQVRHLVADLQFTPILFTRQQHQVHKPRRDQDADEIFAPGDKAHCFYLKGRVEERQSLHPLLLDAAIALLKQRHLCRHHAHASSPITRKSSLLLSHTGQVQCGGRAEKGVPAGMCQ